MHLFGHLYARLRCCPFQDFRIVVIEPLDAVISIKWLDSRAHPAAKIAIAVGVNFYFACGLTHVSTTSYANLPFRFPLG